MPVKPKKKRNKKSQANADWRQLDSDQDGLSDYEEINIYGTDPFDPDSDKDGMNDGEEVKRGRNPLGQGKLKDLFIPHQGNDYKPQILHPYRLIFYTASILLVQAIVAGFVLFFPISAWLTPDILGQESKKIIQLTNEIRQNLSVNLLAEHSLLDQAAYNKAQDMLVQQYFAHIGPDQNDLADWILAAGYRYDIAGENLAMGFANAEDVINAWTQSRTHYANLIDRDFSDVGVGMVSGPFNGQETTLVAQYFAYSGHVSPAVAEPAPEPLPEPVLEPAPITPPAVEKITRVLNEKIETEPVPEPQPDSELLPEPELISFKPEGTHPPEMAELEEILTMPVLIYPQNNSTINQSGIKLVVYAPEADQVIVYDNNSKITEHNSLASDFFDFTINLREGKHRLSFKSVYSSEQITSGDYLITIDTVGPLVDIEKSKVAIIQTEGQKEEIVKVVAYLSPDIVRASVLLGDYYINLEKSEDAINGFNQWIGQLIIFNDDHKKILDTVVLPIITAEDHLGNVITADISWEDIVPIKPSLIKQYFFIKSHPLKQVDLLFSVETWFYQVILFIATVALLLNIFIEVKKQHPRVILSTLGFISLLIILIII